MIVLTKVHDKILAVLVAIIMIWFTIDKVDETYNSVVYENERAEMLKEPDPLTLRSLDTDMQHLNCGGTLEMQRYTHITKPLHVVVQRKIIRVDSKLVDQEITHLPDITYSDTNLEPRNITYTLHTPKTLGNGVYLYAPILTYKVNKYLTITKPAASQIFTITRPKGCK